MELLILLLSTLLCYSYSNPVLMVEDDAVPGTDDFVFTKNQNLHENGRSREDLLDLLIGWMRDSRERNFHLFKRDPSPGYQRRGNVRYHRCYHNPVACF